MKDLLKFITCGSVDDGKSTLIGHLLYDAKQLFTDQERALELDSRVGSADGAMDYSLLLDGLMAEREQGITIDVAYRYFTTEKRSFIVADCPGHEQYTRNMAVGASFADLAVLLVDATNGLSVQTKRHIRVCTLMGIRHVVLAVNKMDLIHYDEQRFHEVRRAFKRYVADFELDSMQVIPVSATVGDNVVNPSGKMPWYQGKPLLTYLEEIEVQAAPGKDEFLLPIQRVSRPDHTFRGFQGQIEGGKVAQGQAVMALPGKETATVKQILVTGKPEAGAGDGQAVTVQLDREIDISRGSVLVSPEAKIAKQASMFAASILWMDDEPLVAGRNYLLKCGTKAVSASIVKIKHKVDIESGNEVPTKQLMKNELGLCDVSLVTPIIMSRFEDNKALGGFILIDRVSHMTSACGVIRHRLRRDENVVWQKTDVTPEVRAEKLAQKPLALWFTGLSGAGKSVLSNALEKRLVAEGYHTMLLDGDNVRHGLCRDLGFTETDRVENIRRVAEAVRLLNDAGVIVLTAFISPYRRDRESAADIIGKQFTEIYVSTPLEECERRDVKGLYKKARSGEIPEFTGISSPYEPPEHPAMEINTTAVSVEEAVNRLYEELKERKLI